MFLQIQCKVRDKHRSEIKVDKKLNSMHFFAAAVLLIGK